MIYITRIRILSYKYQHLQQIAYFYFGVTLVSLNYYEYFESDFILYIFFVILLCFVFF